MRRRTVRRRAKAVVASNVKSPIRYENREIVGLHHQEFVAVRSWRAAQ
jgi:hypothetical protein